MSKGIAVIKPYYLKEKAYELGFDEFKNTDIPSSDELELHHFKETAKWANIVSPRLRAMAGFSDRSGRGTYKEHRQVAAIKPGCEEDQPAEAELVDAREIFHELVDAWETGARDAVDDTFDPDSILA